MKKWVYLLCAVWCIQACSSQPQYDLIIRNAQIADGSGSPLVKGDLAVNSDTIAAIGDLSSFTGRQELDAGGNILAPGFINMLSWATTSVIHDGRALSDIHQGVTMEVFGEGWSMGPLNDEMRENTDLTFGDTTYAVQWTALSEYLQYLENKGISPNVGSFVGATTLRIHEIGYDDRPPTTDEMEKMKQLLRSEMENGAFGLGSSLIYAPAFYSDTRELTELAAVAAEYDGMYISHMRSEGNRLLQSMDELITIAHNAGIRAEIYHLKMAGQSNWNKYDAAIAKIDSARQAGLEISTNMYTYTAGATGLDAAMPPWVQEGGYDKWAERLRDPEIRKRVIKEMRTPSDDWENLLLAARSADNVLLSGFNSDYLKPFTGMTLAEVAEIRDQSPEETAIDLVIEDSSRVGTVYFLMSEENVRKQIALPWMSFGSDGGAPAPEGVFLESNPHPRAYGNFARLLGRYVREEGIISIEEAVYRLTGLPASNLKLNKRGQLREGYYADLVLFNPDTITDLATFEEPHQLATGVQHVFVNGTQVLKDGEHTGAMPGRAVYGPGKRMD